MLRQTPKNTGLFLIRVYRMTWGLYFGSRCRFYPSCSAYAEKALQTHVFLKALVLIAWRILRCQPLCLGGLDPVPIKKVV